MTARRWMLIFGFTVVPSVASAQDNWSTSASIAYGLGHVFRWEDQTFGDPPAAGAAIAIAHASGWAFEIAADRVFGLEPHQQPCGLVNVTCVGSGRYGPFATAVTSLSVQYRFHRRARVQPYLVGGLGVLWSRSLHTVTQALGSHATISEFETRDRGFGPDLGAGLRVPLSRGIAVSPEVRWLDAPWLSRANLAVTRLMLRVDYTR